MNIELRPWQMSDLESLVKCANNYNIAKNLTDVFPHPYSCDDGLVYLNMVVYQPQPATVFAVVVDGEAIGSAGITPKHDVYRKNAEIGYWIAEHMWGRGIATAVVRSLTDYAFDSFDVSRVYASVFGTNTGSIRVLEKAGYEFDARIKRNLFKNGEYLDEVIYSVRR